MQTDTKQTKSLKVKAICQTVAFKDCFYLLNEKSGASTEYAQGAMIGLASGIAAASGVPVSWAVEGVIEAAKAQNLFHRLPLAWQAP